jgi:hypothetical protein
MLNSTMRDICRGKDYRTRSMMKDICKDRDCMMYSMSMDKDCKVYMGI